MANWKKFYVYRAVPIDDWFGCMTPQDFLRGPVDEKDFNFFVDLAKFVARKYLKWEGDSDGLYVCPLLNNCWKPKFIVAWKQSNDGTTFVATPVRLDHLETNERLEVSYDDDNCYFDWNDELKVQ